VIIWNGKDLVMLGILAISLIALLAGVAYHWVRDKIASFKRKGKR